MSQIIESDEANDGNDTEDDVDSPASKRRRCENLPYDPFKNYELFVECVNELKDSTVENERSASSNVHAVKKRHIIFCTEIAYK
ncbi:hypothetical protein BpHYR1_009575 [Brachionus plicatilis]|uniref:Uncharacterized protein n=1 Tax=Brachionus plicatilis TaxID=10195 RepID=A0A3M7T8G0_BRAPC|nr:hypothetical protein BpHYR1_009575 [Brachionus plicatilis]